MRIRPVIIAGGEGARLWPASHPGRSKPFIDLVGHRSLLELTWERVAALGSPVVVAVDGQQESVARVLRGIEPASIWCEPVGRNTGPAVAWAVAEVAREDPEDVVAVFPADHLFEDDQALRQAVQRAARAVEDGSGIALLGIHPDRPETGYGYIEAPGSEEVRRVTRFLEKPDAETARSLVQRQDILWNGGVFIMQAGAGLDLIRQSSPELAAFLAALPTEPARQPDDPGRRKLEAAYRAAPATPFDVAVLERCARCVVAPLAAGWSDLGSWDAVWNAGRRDASENNVSQGSVAVDSRGCLVRGEATTVAAFGVEDLVIVARPGEVLVCTREKAPEIRRVVEAVKAAQNGGEA